MSGRILPVRRRIGAALAMLALLLILQPPECAAAQRVDAGAAPASAEPAKTIMGVIEGPPMLGEPQRRAGSGRTVHISTEENRLYVMEGDSIAWSAVIGTGTGDFLEGEEQIWDFSTPAGEFEIQYKERDPVWLLPDWVFVERGEPIPPMNSPERRDEGRLGAAALYLTHDIAIHGTNEPHLLGDAISHGCIRMTNEDVLRLYEEMEIGSPVIIH